jgi:threonine dehydrogenase-like Zn-dependent dehydrogenase
MRAVRIEQGQPRLVDIERPGGDGVLVKVGAVSICGSDLHMIQQGLVEGAILGHEFAGTMPDGSPVAIEPFFGCGGCSLCDEGYNALCAQSTFIGGAVAGGMADYVVVPESTLVPLPAGLPLGIAALVEPLAVAFHGLNQARVTASDRVLVVGAGAIGLAVAAALRSRGIACDIVARYPGQAAVAAALGANPEPGEGYDVAIDAVGNSASVADCVQRVKPRGRIGMVGCFWDPTEVPMSFCAKEQEMIASFTYKCRRPGRTFEQAVSALAADPSIADTLITHRFPLEAAGEAFATAADRATGAIKVVFDVAS